MLTTGEHLVILANTLSAHGTAFARMTFIVEIGSAGRLDQGCIGRIDEAMNQLIQNLMLFRLRQTVKGFD